MKNNTIKIKFKVKGDKPSELIFDGNDRENNAISDMQICVEIVRGSSKTIGMEWIIVDIEEADGFSYRIRTTLNDGNAVTEFGVPEECSKSDKLSERLAQFKEIFKNSGLSTETLH